MKNTTTIPAVIIPAKITEKVAVIDITNELSSMYAPIGCDIVEPVALSETYKACLWVDEEGLCKSAPINIRASCLAGRPIYGNAIMAGQDKECNIVPLSLACPKIFFDSLEEEAVRFVYEIVKAEMTKTRM